MKKQQATLLSKYGEHGITTDDFYFISDHFGEKCILKRTGIDKIMAVEEMSFHVMGFTTTPWRDKSSITLMGYAKVGDKEAQTVVTVNCENCAYPNFSEVAEKRCKHRLLLQLTGLYAEDIYSAIESDKWTEQRVKYKDAVENVINRLKDK